MKTNQMITFKYCERIFVGSLSSNNSLIDFKPLIYFVDFDGTVAWISQSQVEVIKIG